jgi:glycerol-3-phosphate dehydrogenase (NAD(P)+)
LKTVILGSGSWGTALANVLANNNEDVTIWGINSTEVNDININHQNSNFFKNVNLNVNVKATLDFDVVKDAEIILLAVPSSVISNVCERLYKTINNKVIVINVAKGFHPQSNERLSVVIKDVMKDKLEAVVSLIGPSHAEEVILGLLTSINAVSDNIDAAIIIQKLFSNNFFRVYTNTDVIGAEIGVALKNIIAIASGMIEGLDQGDNARAALMTRGLAEISRFGVMLGARPETFLGLCGVGDLIVTCTSIHSRNFQAGLTIGKANSAKAFIDNNNKTVEGIKACKSVFEQAIKLNISMPITEQMYYILFENKLPSLAMEELMQRTLKHEH